MPAQRLSDAPLLPAESFMEIDSDNESHWIHFGPGNGNSGVIG